jgi:hypothetical protein
VVAEKSSARGNRHPRRESLADHVAALFFRSRKHREERSKPGDEMPMHAILRTLQFAYLCTPLAA